MKKILFIGTFPPPYGGVSVWNQRILKYLQKKNTEINYIPWGTKFGIKGLVFYKQIIYLFIKLISLIGKNITIISDTIRCAKKIGVMMEFLRKIDGDSVVYTHHADIRVLFLILLKEKYFPNVKIVIHEHGSGVIEFAERRPQLVQYILTRADKIIVASEFMKQTCMKRGADTKKIVVVPCGIEFKDLKKPIKEELVMFCGALESVKQPLKFVKSIPSVLNKRPNTKFVIIGKGSLETEIRGTIQDLGIGECVELLGEIPNHEVQGYFEKSKLFVLPSNREPFGIVLIEALNSYTPCIVTNIGGMPEIIDSDVGIVLQNDESFELGNSIAELLIDVNRWNEMSEKAYVKSKSYDMEKVGDRIFEELMGGYNNEA